MWNYYNILQGGSLRFVRKTTPDSWTIHTFFGSVDLPNPGAANFHILSVGFDELVFSTHKQMAIYANAIDWNYFNETHHVRFNKTSVYQGKTYKIGKTPPTLSEIRDNIAAIQELSCNCGAVLMGAMATRPSNYDVMPTNMKYDAGAHALAKEIGGKAQARFRYSNREYDAISSEWIGQHKPGLTNSFGKSFRNQAKATFEDAQATGRGVYYKFDSKPAQEVINKLGDYSKRYNVKLKIKY
ncbi:restriction endonuclease fold toxin [Chryseobacterium takakiae]|nr:restriction endonuclease fold toxin [Chryseobacterium takakiae]